MYVIHVYVLGGNVYSQYMYMYVYMYMYICCTFMYL